MEILRIEIAGIPDPIRVEVSDHSAKVVDSWKLIGRKAKAELISRAKAICPKAFATSATNMWRSSSKWTVPDTLPSLSDTAS